MTSSQFDLLRAKLSSVIDFSEEARKELLEAIDVEKVLTHDVKFADPNEPTAHAAKRMLELKIGCLPVIGEEKGLLGLITETDVMRYFVQIVDEDDS